MPNEEAKHQLEQVLSQFDEQMQDFATVRQKQASLTGTGAAADGSVEVTVDGQGVVIKTVIEESYLDDHDFAELADHITEAARAASNEVRSRWSGLLGPMNRRAVEIAGMTSRPGGAPSVQELLGQLQSLTAMPAKQPSTESADVSPFPTVKE